MYKKLVKDLFSWTCEGITELSHLILIVFISFAAIAIIFFYGRSEQAIRYTGLILQVIGSTSIAHDIYGKHKSFPKPGPIDFLRSWITRMPTPKKSINLTVHIHEGSDSISAVGTVSASDTLTTTLEDRVSEIEKAISRVDNRIDEFHQENIHAHTILSAELEQEKQGRHIADTKFMEKLEEATTGGLKISAVGAWCFFLGSTLSTVSQEFAK